MLRCSTGSSPARERHRRINGPLEARERKGDGDGRPLSTSPNLSPGGVSSVLTRALHSGRVWTILGVGSLLCLALAYACFRIGRANGWRLGAFVIPAIFLVYLAAFLQRTALRVFRRARLSRVRAGKRPYKVHHRRVKDWLPDAAIVFVLCFALVGWNAVMLQWLPDALQDHVEWLAAVLAWLLFIIFWLPLAAAALLGERTLWKPALRAWRSSRYWAGTLACAGLWQLTFSSLDPVLMRLRGRNAQIAGGIVLLALIYALALGAWLVILALVEEAIAAPELRSLEDTWD